MVDCLAGEDSKEIGCFKANFEIENCVTSDFLVYPC